MFWRPRVKSLSLLCKYKINNGVHKIIQIKGYNTKYNLVDLHNRINTCFLDPFSEGYKNCKAKQKRGKDIFKLEMENLKKSLIKKYVLIQEIS